MFPVKKFFLFFLLLYGNRPNFNLAFSVKLKLVSAPPKLIFPVYAQNGAVHCQISAFYFSELILKGFAKALEKFPET